MGNNPSILFIDIETSPNLAYVWRMFKENVSLPQLIEATQVISFAAKWRGKRKVEFYSDFHDGHEDMINRAFELLDAADLVVHYNGTTFDVPHLNREFLLAGTGGPPSPFKNVDLLQTMKKRFRFASNKLDHVTQQLGQAGKVKHTGFQLWRDCMSDDPKAWALMRKYNKGDVTELEELYDSLLPWIVSHPHVGLYDPEVNADEDGNAVVVDVCSRCGSADLERRGFAYTNASKFQQYRCRTCGGWSRGKRAIGRVDARGVN